MAERYRWAGALPWIQHRGASATLPGFPSLVSLAARWGSGAGPAFGGPAELNQNEPCGSHPRSPGSGPGSPPTGLARESFNSLLPWRSTWSLYAKGPNEEDCCDQQESHHLDLQFHDAASRMEMTTA